MRDVIAGFAGGRRSGPPPARAPGGPAGAADSREDGAMPMLCLAGAFPVTGTEPDGDSLRFRPDDPADWTKVPGAHRVHTNATGAAQPSADALDALETHYSPTGGHTLHQPLGLAHAAAA